MAVTASRFLERAFPRAAVPRARALIVLGAVSAAAGVALSGTFYSWLGGVLLVEGWISLIAGIHGFGRAGVQLSR
jgi:hypothetical protein